MALSPGAKLGPYQVNARLGRGGMGEVYSAIDNRLDRPVAIKVLPAELEADRDRRRRLLREAKSAASLAHPNVCTLYEVGEHDGCTYIAMEHIAGRTIADVLTPNGLPADEVVRYGIQIADALAYAHDQGVIHRDLKAANVMVTPEGRVKVVDFGLAKRLRGDDIEGLTQSNESITIQGAVAGTLAYMAPEVLAGKPADERCDIWALGVLLYVMLTGRLPFRGGTAFELTAAILRESPSPLASSVLPSLRATVDHCLAKKRAQRYQRAGEVRAALETVYQDLKVGSSSDGTLPAETEEATLELGSHLPTTSVSPVGAQRPTSSVEIQALDRLAGTLVPIVTAAKIVAGATIGLLVLGFLGFLTSATFDLALQVPHQQSILEYVVFGVRAILPALVLMLIEVVLVAGAAALYRVATWLRRRAKRGPTPKAEIGGLERARAWLTSLSASAVVAALISLSFACVVAVGAVSWPLVRTIEQLVEQPLDVAVDTSALSPANDERHYLVTWVAATALLLLAGAWALGLKSLRRKGLEGSALALLRSVGLASALAVAAITAAPWRLVWNNEREPVLLEGRRGYVVHQAANRLFLYAPRNRERSIEVGTDDARLERMPNARHENIFSTEP